MHAYSVCVIYRDYITLPCIRRCTTSTATAAAIVRTTRAVRRRQSFRSSRSELLALARVASLRQSGQNLVDRGSDDKLLLGEGADALREADKGDVEKIWSIACDSSRT